MWTLGILFQLSIIFECEPMTVGPRNMAVVVGQRMEMKCQAGANWQVTEWFFQNTTTSHWEKLFVVKINEQFSKPIRPTDHLEIAITGSESSMLYAKSTQLDDAGLYTCAILEGTAQPRKYIAHLFVFESDPVCSSNSTLPLSATIQQETYVWLRCMVKFRGNLVPAVEWRKHEGDGEEFEEGREITNFTDTVEISNSSIASELIVFVTTFNRSISYSWKIYFKSINDSELRTATNAPDYIYKLKMPVLVVSTNRPTDSRIESADLAKLLTIIGSVSVVVALSVVAVIIVCIRRRRSLNQAPVHLEPFTEVPSVASTQGISTPGVPPSNVTQRSGKPNYFGDDGTEYMEVNNVVRQPIPVRLQTETNIFSAVDVYACIDHTLSPPIPPRGKLA